MKRIIINRKLPLVAGILLVFLSLWVQFSAPESIRAPMQRLEALLYDLRLNLTLPDEEVDKRIVIIDIGETSLEEIGHWPWPRDVIAQLMDALTESGVIVVGFDMVFPEEERNSIDEVLESFSESGELEKYPGISETLRRHRDSFDNNRVFSSALHDRDVVLGFVFDYSDGNSVGLLPEPPDIINLDAALRALPESASNYTANIPTLQEATPYGGFFSLVTDRDGIIRRAPMLARIDDRIYPSLSAEMLRVLQLVDEIEVKTAEVGGSEVIEGLVIGTTTIPTDRRGQAIVPYKGLQGSFPYISAADVIKGRVDTTLLEGAVALIGTTAHGLFDLRSTPVQSIYPGVEVHANLIAGALDQRTPSRPEWAKGVEFLLILSLGLLVALSQPFLSPLRLIVGSIVVSLIVVGVNFYIWNELRFILNMALPLLMVLAISVLNLAYGFLHESRARSDLKGRFGQYVPPELVREMSDNPDASYGFDGETREMTVMFSDIRNFTTISESLDASQLKSLLNRFFSPMTKIIFDKRGTIDKYVGDMIMAFWGAPLPDENHALNAVRAAHVMLRKAVMLTGELQQQGMPEITIGVGINTGLMNVGDMGSEYRRAYTVLGDAVNQGSRLEALTKYYGVSLLIGEQTYASIKGSVSCREIDLVKVKGKSEAVRIYEPLDPEGDEFIQDTDELDNYHDAINAYRERQWEFAEAAFTALNSNKPHRLYELYITRCASYRTTPPPAEWDGVYQHQQKGGGE